MLYLEDHLNFHTDIICKTKKILSGILLSYNGLFQVVIMYQTFLMDGRCKPKTKETKIEIHTKFRRRKQKSTRRHIQLKYGKQ